MTLFQFIKMTPQSQTIALSIFGAFAASRKVDKNCLLLFQIDAIYVELLYDRVNSDIEIIRSFKSTNMLEPYVDNVYLESLLSDI